MRGGQRRTPRPTCAWMLDMTTPTSLDELLIVGLGNPGPEYAGSRHNVGRACLEAFASRVGVPLSRKRWRSLVGSGTVNLPAPSTGTYKGISIFQARSSDAAVNVAGNGGMNITGTFYAAGAQLNVTGNGGLEDGIPKDNIGAQYVSKDLKIDGNGSFNIVYTDDNPIAIRVIQLIE